VRQKVSALFAAIQAPMALLWMTCAANGMDAGAGGAPGRPSCGTGDECAELAKRYGTGKGAPKDSQVASDLYLMACDKGHALSCSDLADMLAFRGLETSAQPPLDAVISDPE
jgi:TPR repeat protein